MCWYMLLADCEHACGGAASTGLESRLLLEGANRDLLARLWACPPWVRWTSLP